MPLTAFSTSVLVPHHSARYPVSGLTYNTSKCNLTVDIIYDRYAVNTFALQNYNVISLFQVRRI